MIRHPPSSPPFPYTPLFRSLVARCLVGFLRQTAREGAHRRGLERHALLLRVRRRDEPVRKRTAEQRETQACSQKIATTQGLNPLRLLYFLGQAQCSGRAPVRNHPPRYGSSTGWRREEFHACAETLF